MATFMLPGPDPVFRFDFHRPLKDVLPEFPEQIAVCVLLNRFHQCHAFVCYRLCPFAVYCADS